MRFHCEKRKSGGEGGRVGLGRVGLGHASFDGCQKRRSPLGLRELLSGETDCCHPRNSHRSSKTFHF